MPFSIPALKAPNSAITACANRISLVEFPELAEFIPQAKIERIADAGNGTQFVRVIRERFDSEGTKAHFHLDVLARDPNKPPPEGTISLSELGELCDLMIGKTLHINFNSQFTADPNALPPSSMVKLFGSMGIKFASTTATLSAANIRIADTIFREIRWKQIEGHGAKPQFSIEIAGTLGSFPVTAGLLESTRDRIDEGFNRFVLGKLQ